MTDSIFPWAPVPGIPRQFISFRSKWTPEMKHGRLPYCRYYACKVVWTVLTDVINPIPGKQPTIRAWRASVCYDEEWYNFTVFDDVE